MHGSAQLTADVTTSGCHGTSRDDSDVALYAAMAGVTVGVYQHRMRRLYDLTEWNVGEEATGTWARERVEITIIAAHTATVNLTRDSVRYVPNLLRSSKYMQDGSDDGLEVLA